MLGALVQEWITLQGAANTSIAQAASSYIDATYVQDFSFWLELGTITGAPSIYFETAPGNEEFLFLPMVPGVVLASAPVTLPIVNIYGADAAVPPARFVRWRIASTSAWAATFRIFGAMNPAGA